MSTEADAAPEADTAAAAPVVEPMPALPVAAPTPAPAPRAPDPTLRNFATLLATLEDGALHDEATQKYRELVTALNDQYDDQRGKPKGKITIEIELQRVKDTVELFGKVTTTTPKRARERTILYPTRDGTLSPRNPRQMDLPFRDVNAKPETRSV